METVIEHMDVQFDVEGDDDEVFTRLFRRHIEAWARADRERRNADERARRERGIGGGGRNWGSTP
jgi:hypothetical protein